MIRYLLSATALAAIAVAAAAPVQAQAREAGNFGGVKLGVVAGYDNVSLEYEGLDADDDGVLYGVTAGYDLDLGGAVIGLELEASDSSVAEKATNLIYLGDSLKLSSGRDLYVGARIGFPVTRNLLIYAKGGYTNARAKLTYNDGTGFAVSESDTLEGWRLGGGVEMSSATHFARVEYRYSDYGDYHYDGFNTGLSASRQQVAVTGGFRF